MYDTHYIGFDVHKKTVSYCAKTADGNIADEGTVAAERAALRAWAEARPLPWHGAMEATLFSGWIYDTLKPYAQQLDMAHPAMMKAIAAGKKKDDQIDARKISDLIRCNWLPVCYVAPPEMRELRRLLRYRNLVVRQSVRMQNKIAGLLMETGTSVPATEYQVLLDRKFRARTPMASIRPRPAARATLHRGSDGRQRQRAGGRGLLSVRRGECLHRERFQSLQV